MHTLDIAPLRSESPPLQKRSGMARVLKWFHSFTCTPTRSSAIGMSHTCLCLPSYNWYSFTDPGGMEGWVDLGDLVWSSPGRDSNLQPPNCKIRHSTTQPLAHLLANAWPSSVFTQGFWPSYCHISTDLDKILHTPIVVRNTLVGWLRPRSGVGGYVAKP